MTDVLGRRVLLGPGTSSFDRHFGPSPSLTAATLPFSEDGDGGPRRGFWILRPVDTGPPWCPRDGQNPCGTGSGAKTPTPSTETTVVPCGSRHRHTRVSARTL